nr:bacterial Ig-like domain-containing protein [uncultured Mediterraneibacter sp.]
MKIKNFKKITAMACACAVVTTAGILPASTVVHATTGWDANRYTTENPFEFPTDGSTKTLEAELATEYSDVCGTQWHLGTESIAGASAGKLVKNFEMSGNNCDSLKYAYTAAQTGCYHVTVRYRSGNVQNGFTVKEESGKVLPIKVTAGAGSVANFNQVEFDLDVMKTGAGTLILTADGSGGPQLDKFDITLTSTSSITAYTAENPYVFPSKVGASTTLEPEFGELTNDSSDDRDAYGGVYPLGIKAGAWCENRYYVDALNTHDTVKIPYTAEKAGTYKFTVFYRSGSNANGFAWSEESNKITSGSVTAGAQDGARETHTAEFEVKITTPGEGVLVLSGISGNAAPQTDKFQVEAVSLVSNVDKTTLNAAITEATKLVAQTETYTSASLAKLREALEVAEALKADDAAEQDAVDAAVTALNAAKEDLVEIAVESIAVTTQPTKVTYEREENLDTAGLVVTAYDNNNGSQVVTDYTVSELDSTTAGTKVITVTYKNLTTTFEVTVNESYVVKVNGQVYARGQYNDLVTITAEEKEGHTFAGWEDASGKVVSTKATYSFRLAGDRTFTSVYDKKVEVEAQAKMDNAYVASKNADRSGNVRFMGQIVVPKGYRVEECGVIWTGRNKTNMPELYTFDGNTFTAVGKKVAVKKYTCTYQFGVAVNNVPAGKTARGVVYAKLTNGTDTKYVFSEENSVTVK